MEDRNKQNYKYDAKVIQRDDKTLLGYGQKETNVKKAFYLSSFGV